MADMNLPLSYFISPKARKIIRRLGPRADVFPLRLWVHVAMFRPMDGRLDGYTAEDIEDAVDWDGEPDEFVKAMLAVGWLEQLPGEAGYQCHKWLEYQGHFKQIHTSLKNAREKRWKHKNGVASEAEDWQLETKSVTERPGIAPGSNGQMCPAGLGPPGEQAHTLDHTLVQNVVQSVPAIPSKPANPYQTGIANQRYTASGGALPGDPAGVAVAAPCALRADQPAGLPASLPCGPVVPAAPAGVRPPQEGTAADAGSRGDDRRGQLASGSKTGLEGQQLACGSNAGFAAVAAVGRLPQDGTAADAGVAMAQPVNGAAVSGLRPDGQQGKEGAGRQYEPPPKDTITEKEEKRLMQRLRDLLSDREIDEKGGHWRSDWVRPYPGLVVRGIVELETQIKERGHRGHEPILNRAAWLESVLVGWKRRGLVK